MNFGTIYLREADGLVPMKEAGYDAERILQKLLEQYPDLLAGEQMRPKEPRRWLLIRREAGVPDSDGTMPRWYLDHLFIDQDSIPTLVEVKRSTDTRIRREVVGQMLDYAANLVAYWPVGQLRQVFEERARTDETTADEEVLSFLRPPGQSEEEATPLTEDEAASTVDEFWQRAASNLAARRIRLVFVADSIPSELQRIIEFLNENLVLAEVLAVEVKQYVGEGRQTLVPRVIGRTAAAEDLKQLSGGAKRELTDAQRLHLEYWSGFRDYLVRRSSEVRMGRPPANSIAAFKVGPNAVELRAYNRLNDGRCGVYIETASMESATAHGLVDRDRAEATLTGLGTAKWSGSPESDLTLTIARKMTPTDKQTWPDHMQWMEAALVRLAGLPD